MFRRNKKSQQKNQGPLALKEIMQKNYVTDSCSSSASRLMGFVCYYQLDKKSFQFSFIHVDNKGANSINYQLSFCTENYVRLVASCNGLLLLTSKKKKELIYHVFNPLTRESFCLPQNRFAGKIVRSGLAADEHQNYQVVLLVRVSSRLELEIFSSETGKWKKNKTINLFLPLRPESLFSEPTPLPLFSNGAIHWEVLDHLLIYNVQNHHCELIKLPSVSERSYQKSAMRIQGCLWEAEGRVRYCYTDTDGVHVWYLLGEQDLDCFSKYHNIDREKFRWALADSLDNKTLKKNYPKIFQHGNELKPHYVSPFAYNEDSQTMYMRLPGIVISYNTKTGAVEEVCSFKYPGKDFNHYSFFPFVCDEPSSLEIAGEKSEERKMVALPTKKVKSSLSF